MITYLFAFGNLSGSSFLSPAHGWSGARATIKNISVPPSEKIAGGFQQAGKKEGGLGEGILPASEIKQRPHPPPARSEQSQAKYSFPF